MSNLFSRIDTPLHAIADLFTCLAHNVGYVGRREGVRIDVNVQTFLFGLRFGTTGLIHDAQVKWIY